MKNSIKVVIFILIISALTFTFSLTSLAVTEADVRSYVAAYGRSTVAGNVFIWFLCAVAFLKISHKIDSFMASLGINVGNTGGSMLAELLIASRGVAAGKRMFEGGGLGGLFGGRGMPGSGGSGGAGGASGSMGGFMSGGLAGVVARSFNRGAMRTATNGESGGFGGMMFTSSMEKGGDFANNVISSVAKGNITSTGMMTGETAVKAMNSYMGYTAKAKQAETMDISVDAPEQIPSYINVEIGGGRIMGTEVSVDNPNGIVFGMYNTEQYMIPEGKYETISTVDGASWYKQYAQDAVEKSPYMAPDGSIAYNESIVQKLPNIPRRRDRV
jgi:hypothetical protein